MSILRRCPSVLVSGHILLWSAASVFAATAWRDVAVEFSDGRAIAAKAQFTNDQLTIFNETQQRRVTVGCGEIGVFEAVVEREEMAKKWFFKEGGNDEKVYTGETYPVKEFLGRVTFGDGRSLEGHLISSTVTLQEGDTRSRWFLPRKMEGKVGQKLDELVFIRKITFQGGAAAGVLGTISGAIVLPDNENLLTVVAVHQDKGTGVVAALPPGNRFRFEQLTIGVYDIAVVSDRTIYYSSSREKAQECVRFDAPALKEIGDWAAKVNDFYTAHVPLYCAGNAQSALALVAMERRGDMTLEGGALDRRYELWLMEKPAGEWRIKSRAFVHRELLKTADVPARTFSACPQLGGLTVSRESPSVSLVLRMQPLPKEK